ncbi:MAG: hypothetical protein PQJ49_00550 [Sphaerochaetaceae bacterium]|nr:hypothetical protein [Sphaerochaetaceae bacterium]MDC7236425.1 hypothetical protein [Sphaerochaetaceae bacterium]MDC7248394.1 hypothetical protein [Sphaerochaetaceae bacterium]
MDNIILTLTFIIYLLSLLMIIRFVFTPEWLSWVFPLVITLIFVISQAYQSFAIMKSENLDSDLFSQFPPFVTKANSALTALLISIFWLLSIILFYKAIKRNRKPKDKRREAMKNNYYGAQYTQLLEAKKMDYMKKIKKEEENFGFIKPTINKDGDKWVKLFDDDNEDNK